MNADPKPSSGFDVFERRLVLSGTLRVETALRVGSGQSDELNNADIAVFKDAERRPYIPGSSLKGALRAHVERIVRSLPSGAACDPLNEDARCITKETMESWRDTLNPAQLAQQIFSHSCHVCRVFGSPWLASKVLFKDLQIKQLQFWFEHSYQTRAGVGIERDSDTAQEGVLYTTEVVPPGVEFAWEIIVENADPETEEPLLFLGLREMEGDPQRNQSGKVPLGGGKSRGLGRVSLTVDQVTCIDQGGLVDYLISNKPPTVEWADLKSKIPAWVHSLASSASTSQESSHA